MDLHVLTVARTLPHQIQGGLEEASWQLARALAKSGVRETLLTSSLDGVRRVYRRDGVEIHEVPYIPKRLRHRPPHRWWPFFGRAAAHYAQKEGLRPDLVHSQSFYLDGFLAQPSRPPLVATIHGTAWGDYVGGSRDKLRREAGRFHPRRLAQLGSVLGSSYRQSRLLRRIDAIVPVSQHLARRLPGLRGDEPNVHVIPNGIDPDEFPWVEPRRARQELALPRSAKVLLFLGRVEEYKGVHQLLPLVRRDPELVLVVAGDGSFLPTLRAEVAKSPEASRIRILGSVADEKRPVLYAAADLFCLPSRQEGQPVTLLESLAMGTPVATTQDWVPPGLGGFAITGSDVHRLVDGGLRLSASLDRSKVRKTVLDGFSWRKIASSYRAVIDEAIRARRETGADVPSASRAPQTL